MLNKCPYIIPSETQRETHHDKGETIQATRFFLFASPIVAIMLLHISKMSITKYLKSPFSCVRLLVVCFFLAVGF